MLRTSLFRFEPEFGQLLFHFREPASHAFQFGRFDGAHLQVRPGCKAGTAPRVDFAGVDADDPSAHRIPYGNG